MFNVSQQGPRSSLRGRRLLRGRRGFTAAELSVVILIVVVLFSIFIPFIRKTRETDHRVRCQSNLRAIGFALWGYAKSNDGSFPRVVFDAANVPHGYFAFTGPYAPNPFAGDGRVSANDVTASLWLLVRTGYMTPSSFICPSTSDDADPAPESQWRQQSNFKRARNLSYSYASPFSTAAGYKFDENFPAGFVLMADKNPGRSGTSDVTAPACNAPVLELARANSNNHQRAGQNVLYADAHVDFVRTPYCGYGYDAQREVPGDNIFTVLAEKPLPEKTPPDLTVRGLVGPQYSPAWASDTYLVPLEGQDRP